MKFGFHISIAGGLSKVLERAKIRGCETLQLFSRNPRGWKFTALDAEEVKKFRKDFEKKSIWPLFVHMPCLPNLATPDESLYIKSVASLCEDLKRTEELGVDFLIMHVGSHLGGDEETAVKRVAEGVNQGLARVKNKVILLLENTAGSGSEIGYSFMQIKDIIEQIDDKSRIGVALDVAHAFESGYDLRTRDGVSNTIADFDKKIGLKKLYLLHLNDSKSEYNSRVDRHWHIGKGKIGIEGFLAIVNHQALRHLPGIMETPRTDTKEDLKNMAVIKSLVR